MSLDPAVGPGLSRETRRLPAPSRESRGPARSRLDARLGDPEGLQGAAAGADDEYVAAGRPQRVLGAAVLAVVPALLLTLLLCSLAPASVRSTATKHGKGERIKTVPIAKRAWGKPRSVMSLSRKQIGKLRRGDKIKAMGEVELTICLKPDPRHPGGGQPCVGDMYGYNPTMKARLVLAPSARAAGPGSTKRISRTVSLTCHQNHPNRNHHCVVAVPWGGMKITDPGSLPCKPARCRVNMIVSVHHPNAGAGDRVVVGSSDDNKRIHQGKGKLSAVRYRPGDTKPKKRWRGGRATKRVPVVSKSAKIKRKVIYSAKVGKVRAGDQLVVDARVRTAIGHLPYNVFQRTEVVLAKSRKSTRAFGKATETTARISASNGLNCTQGKSGHSNVCTLRKGGVVGIKKGRKRPLFVNVVVGQHAIGTATQYRKWRPGQRSKVPKRGGYVRVERYRGGCGGCATGLVRFSKSKRPSQRKPAKLVQQLSRFGIHRGKLSCFTRRHPRQYVCSWKSSGRIGSSPRYRCHSKAWWRNKAGRFKLKVCKDQLGAQLWNRLVHAKIPVAPSYTGACKEKKGRKFKCKWFGEGVRGELAGRYCKGYGRYDARKHTWRIDPCRDRKG
jgi:hypothetical protein